MRFNRDNISGSDHQGFSLVELMVTMAIFTVLLAGVFGAYFSQLENTTREYRSAESEIELGIGKQFVEQDLLLSGYGLADDYSPLAFDPRPARVVNNTTSATTPVPAAPGRIVGSDELYLMGTALGLKNRASQGWSYFTSNTPTFRTWPDNREQIRDDDRVILVEPSSKQILVETVSGNWLFDYNAATPNVVAIPSGTTYGSPEIGTLIYGLYNGNTHDANAKPFYTVRYYLAGTPPEICADGTRSLLRAESVESLTPVGGDPLMACVRDMQVAFGLDTDENGNVDAWDDGGTTAALYSLEDMSARLKRIKVFLLVQSGGRDDGYTYPSATVRVGEVGLGRDITLTAEQRKYRWHLVTLSVQPRNVR